MGGCLSLAGLFCRSWYDLWEDCLWQFLCYLWIYFSYNQCISLIRMSYYLTAVTDAENHNISQMVSSNHYWGHQAEDARKCFSWIVVVESRLRPQVFLEFPLTFSFFLSHTVGAKNLFSLLSVVLVLFWVVCYCVSYK